jgi:CBS domain-containing protein
MANGHGRQRGRARHTDRERRRRQRWTQERPAPHGLDLVTYLDELADVRFTARENLVAAGELALKVLDRFLGNLARALGMDDERASMGDSIRWLERIPGTPHEIAVEADRFRDTRNALAHNPDVTLRPEAAHRIIDGAESIIRMAAAAARDLSRSSVVTALDSEPLADARDRLLQHRYDQLVVVDARGGVVDLLTDRDIVLIEARADVDIDDSDLSVAEGIAARGHPAVAILPTGASADEAVDALRDEHIGAVVLTANGQLGEPPLGIITRKDVLRAR